MGKKIKMLMPGEFPAKSGVVPITAADLIEAAESYDPKLYMAGLVKGHPADDEPRYGDIASAEFDGSFLFGETINVDPVFKGEVNSGRYPYGSLALYGRNHPGNPCPGKLYIKHFGLLGAVPPACKGTGRIELSETGEPDMLYGVIEFGDWNDMQIARTLRRLKNWMIGKFGQDEADKALDEWDVQGISEEAARPEPPMMEQTPAFAEPHQKGGDSMALTAEELKTREDALKAGEASLAKQLNEGKHKDNLEFVEGLVRDGKLAAVNKAGLVAVLDFAAGATVGETIEFGEGDAKKTEAPLTTLKSIFGALPKIIEFGELGGGEEPGTQSKTIPAAITTLV